MRNELGKTRDVPTVRHRLLLFVAVVGLHALSPNAMVTDSYQVVPVAQKMLHAGTISLGHAPTPEAVPPLNALRAHGQFYPVFPWTVSVFVLPVVAVADAAHGLGMIDKVPDDW